MHEWLSGGVSPCQGEGRGFESRLVLSMIQKRRYPLDTSFFVCSSPAGFERFECLRSAPVVAVNAPYQVPYKLKAASAALLHCFFGFLTTSGNFSDHGSRSSKNDRSLSSMRLGISVRRCSKYSYGFRLFAFAVSAML